MPALDRVLGVAGWQGSGKTTLLEALVATLVADGLSVVVVKHDAHGLAFDVAGKDSDRLSRAGAEVIVDSPAERFERTRRDPDEPLLPRLVELERRCDLVLVEGYKGGPQPKVWLLREGEAAPPADVGEVLAALPWDGDRVAFVAELVRRRLAAAWADAPRRAGVLVGGASRRMGTPKQWLQIGGETLLARVAGAVAAAGPLALLGGDAMRGPDGDGSVAAAPGSNDVALVDVGSAATAVRLPDAPDVRGPLAGILAALRWAPVCWLVASCDLPRLRATAVDWLLAERRPGRWAVLPRVGGVVQPLLAVYEPQGLPLLEAIAADGASGPSRLEGHPHVATPEPPSELADCWRGVNTPQELAELVSRTGS
jgi:molybdopterin-guanine dinucleotide biosynthesis protein MobB